MRSIALAEACRSAGGTATFLTSEGSPGLVERIGSAGFETHLLMATPGSTKDASHTAGLARSIDASWVVADGYSFGVDYQRRVGADGLSVLLIDDVGQADAYSADVILNQNLDAHAGWYENRKAASSLLLGPRYALVRSEFGQYKTWSRTTAPVARRLLVTLGGSDPDNVTSTISAAIAGLDLEVRVVVGASYPHDLPVPSAVRDARNMPELMAWADLAISAAGSTWCELAFMGLPALVMVLADNQIEIAAAIDRHEFGINLGWHSEVQADGMVAQLEDLARDPTRRRSMGERGRALVDGLGAGRVIEVLMGGGVRHAASKADTP
jgi:UDP-2,4-diacetamido-2,4,6-trideoxy-beta-L-altropyranose hydrolase